MPGRVRGWIVTNILDVPKGAVIADDLVALFRRHCGRHHFVLEVCVLCIVALSAMNVLLTASRL